MIAVMGNEGNSLVRGNERDDQCLFRHDSVSSGSDRYRPVAVYQLLNEVFAQRSAPRASVGHYIDNCKIACIERCGI